MSETGDQKILESRIDAEFKARLDKLKKLQAENRETHKRRLAGARQ